MNIKKQILLTLLIAGNAASFAQERRIKEEGTTLFNPHWFIQAQVGAAHTVGEANFSDLISPTAAINVGYKFAPAFGVRIGASGWQAKGGWVSPQQNYAFNYLQGSADLMVDLGTLFAKFNPSRVCNAYLFGGIGVNHAFDNNEAGALHTNSYAMDYLWTGSQNLMTGRLGLGCDFRLSDRLAINIEANANTLADKFNSKKAGNSDWQFNALVGLSIKLGKSYTKTATVYYEQESVAPQPVQFQPVVEQVQPKETEVVVEAMKQNVFFALNSARIQDDQLIKIDALVVYLKKYPNAKVSVAGYADKNTGNARINMTLSQARASHVAKALQEKGIAIDRISTDAKGDTVQPYNTPEENRVTICITE